VADSLDEGELDRVSACPDDDVVGRAQRDAFPASHYKGVDNDVRA